MYSDEKKTHAWDERAARELAAGKVLIPYWGKNKEGVRVALSCWDTLRPGETLRDAARRRSVPAPQPEWTAQLKEKVDRILREILAAR